MSTIYLTGKYTDCCLGKGKYWILSKGDITRAIGEGQGKEGYHYDFFYLYLFFWGEDM